MEATATERVNVARALAQSLLIDQPARWQHTIAVARRCEQLATAVATQDQEIVLIAAWLHDIGYSGTVRDTGFHPLDGARYLARLGWPARVCALVARHSGAVFVADAMGLHDALAVFPDEQSRASDALTYADQTVGPHGELVSIGWRMADMLTRHGPASPQARVHHAREPYLVAVAHRVEARLGGFAAA